MARVEMPPQPPRATTIYPDAGKGYADGVTCPAADCEWGLDDDGDHCRTCGGFMVICDLCGGPLGETDEAEMKCFACDRKFGNVPWG